MESFLAAVFNSSLPDYPVRFNRYVALKENENKDKSNETLWRLILQNKV